MSILVINDLHLGDGSKADDFGKNDQKMINWIEEINPNRIILNGDIEDLWQFKRKRIRKAHKLLLDYFKHKKATRIIGNHDYKILGKNSISIKTKNGKLIFITHGHQADKRMDNAFVRGFVWFLGIVERLPFMGNIDNPDMWGKKKSSADKKTEAYAMSILANGKYHIVICGHTHKLTELLGDQGYVIEGYLNGGTCQHERREGILIDEENGTAKVISKSI